MEAGSKRSIKASKALLYLVSGITLVVGLSVAFEGTTEDERLLGSTFGAGMGLFGIALTAVAFRTRDRLAWAALWYFPVFFAIHIAVLGIWVPDLPLLALAAGALLVSRRAFGQDAAARPGMRARSRTA